MWTNSHASQPIQSLQLDPRQIGRPPTRGRSSPCRRDCGRRTARSGCPSVARMMFRAACAPICIATCATPGSGRPTAPASDARSPMTNTCGMARGSSGPAGSSTRPTRSTRHAERRAERRRRHAGGPQDRLRRDLVARPLARRPSPTRVTSVPFAPRRRGARDRGARPRAAARERSASTAGPPSSRMIFDELGSKCRKSFASDSRAISASAPAISTPVGPPPMMTNVSSGRRRAGSGSRSARSNASSTRRRISSASSSVFRPGACGRHSS